MKLTLLQFFPILKPIQAAGSSEKSAVSGQGVCTERAGNSAHITGITASYNIPRPKSWLTESVSHRESLKSWPLAPSHPSRGPNRKLSSAAAQRSSVAPFTHSPTSITLPLRVPHPWFLRVGSHHPAPPNFASVLPTKRNRHPVCGERSEGKATRRESSEGLSCSTKGGSAYEEVPHEEAPYDGAPYELSGHPERSEGSLFDRRVFPPQLSTSSAHLRSLCVNLLFLPCGNCRRADQIWSAGACSRF